MKRQSRINQNLFLENWIWQIHYNNNTKLNSFLILVEEHLLFRMFIKCMISILSSNQVSPIFTLSIVVIISHTVEVPAMLKEEFNTDSHKIINLLKPHQICNLDCPSTEHIHCSDSSLVCGLHAGNLRLKFN